MSILMFHMFIVSSRFVISCVFVSFVHQCLACSLFFIVFRHVSSLFMMSHHVLSISYFHDFYHVSSCSQLFMIFYIFVMFLSFSSIVVSCSSYFITLYDVLFHDLHNFHHFPFNQCHHFPNLWIRFHHV